MRQVIFASILALIFSFPVFAQAENPPCTNVENSGGVVEAGTPMKFAVSVSGKTDNLVLGYEWKVSAGTIASGQGTCSILVDTTGLANATNITAEVKVKGLPESCPNTLSKIGSVTVRKLFGELLDNFGNLPRDEIRARMDATFISLGNAPNAQAYILSYGADKEIAAREKLIRNHIVFRKYDASRIIFAKCGINFADNGVTTTVWIIPPGAEPPTCR